MTAVLYSTVCMGYVAVHAPIGRRSRVQAVILYIIINKIYNEVSSALHIRYVRPKSSCRMQYELVSIFAAVFDDTLIAVSVTPQSALTHGAQPQSGWHNTGISDIYLRRCRAVHEPPTHLLAIGASPRYEFVAVEAHQVDLRRPNFIYNHS